MSREILVHRYEKSTAFLDREQVIDILAVNKDGHDDPVEREKLTELPDHVLAAELEKRFRGEEMDVDAFVQFMDKHADYDDEWDFLPRKGKR